METMETTINNIPELRAAWAKNPDQWFQPVGCDKKYAYKITKFAKDGLSEITQPEIDKRTRHVEGFIMPTVAIPDPTKPTETEVSAYCNYLYNPNPDDWRALHEQIMALEDEPKVEVKPGQVYMFRGYPRIIISDKECRKIAVDTTGYYAAKDPLKMITDGEYILTDRSLAIIGPGECVVPKEIWANSVVVDEDEIVVNRAEWKQCQAARKAFEGGES